MWVGHEGHEVHPLPTDDATAERVRVGPLFVVENYRTAFTFYGFFFVFVKGCARSALGA